MLARQASLIVLSTVLLFAACATPAASPVASTLVKPTTPASPSSAAPSPATSPTNAGSQLPSLAPMPAAGELAEVALRFRACDIDCHQNPGLTVLTDGRVLRSGEGGMTHRQLTAAGMGLLLDAVRGTGLFTEDATFDPILNPDKQSMGFGPTSYEFDLGSGDEAVHVGSASPGGFEADNMQGHDVWTIPPEVYVLDNLATRLQDLDAWLSPEAWAGPGQPYAAEQYLLITTIERQKGSLPPWPDVDTVAWPFLRSVQFVGDRFVRRDLSGGDSRCLVISQEQAAAMSAAEGAGGAGRERGLRSPYQQLYYTWQRGQGTLDVTTKMILPYQVPTCEGAGGSGW